MPDNFIPRANSSIGQIIGSSFAREHYSTKDVLQQLAQQKAQDIRANQLKQFMPGASPEQLAAIASFPEKWQQAALQGGYGQQQPQQMQQAQAPQMQQQMPQMQQQPMGLEALQQALHQPQREKFPSYQEQEFLRRMQQQYGNQMPQEMQPQLPQVPPEMMQQMPNAQPNQQPAAPNVGQPPQQAAPIGFGEALRLGSEKQGVKSQSQISKEDQQFGLELQKKIDSGVDLERDLDRIDKLINNKDINWGFIASKVPIAQLNTDTKKLVNLFSDILVKQTKVAGQGRGSDLLRKMVEAGKFNLEQGPEVWKDISDRLREEVDYDKKLYKTRHDILREYGGKPPAEVGYLTRERVANDVRSEQANKQSLQNWAKGSEIDELPANDTPQAQALEGRALESKYGPVIYLNGKQYPAVKKNGKWTRK